MENLIAEQKKEIPEDLIRLRNKFPALVSHKSLWPELSRLVLKGDGAVATQIATNHLAKSPRFDLRNRIAIRHRILRREYLKYQIEFERQIKDSFVKFYDKVERLIFSSPDDSGKIPFWRMKSLLASIKNHNTELYSGLRALFAGAIRKSVWFGIVVNMQSAQAGLDHSDKMISQESDLLEKPVAIIGKSTEIFYAIFNRVQQRRIKRGLFTGKGSQTGTSGSSLSQQIWDMRTSNDIKIRRILAAGIAQGRSAGAIATDIKKYTYSSGEPDYKMATSGPGVYRTAWKNALRVARTETNAAYVAAGNEYASQKGYQQMWNVSVGKRTEDECDDLANHEPYDPEEIAAIYPPHPNCSCYFTTVIPDVS